jgi:hypothetical protein
VVGCAAVTTIPNRAMCAACGGVGPVAGHLQVSSGDRAPDYLCHDCVVKLVIFANAGSRLLGAGFAMGVMPPESP